MSQLLSLKLNKSAGYDEISFNVIKNCFDEPCDPLKHIFNLSFEKAIFPDYMKIPKVTVVFKGGGSANFSNCRPISVLPCFSKTLGWLMFNFNSNFLENENLFQKTGLPFFSGNH